ncbi:hypothetical protein PHYBLDRAFT_162440 [Phycomyces blakesleeanus NRRL 1555(-)]|uniref:Uncharacterized protein n=1 Tax=Phycomyces blakesleeanus (strain ATCC 8743b / DSM 1359 / FGSC 10004 / NBRC 33097 / NRRL 1555) TaxID=763407 RepID=A0A167QAD6_PHYB8|nr:hypothetical protein PHYBLDRAFT_162440 [Phycomyces blakesleeanus NRRL 1555(-)]OAD79366.1 hypothetical protein PHYBLDRAFT_162440 [Phycomyces blakesleeanus NRRL 1555(-)]|eukprot:XP_018297406.1 hypothetical protein PHYBLDRAFT_162440 [Phycomyces blakesleeanus NRRL 1555(-)]
MISVFWPFGPLVFCSFCFFFFIYKFSLFSLFPTFIIFTDFLDTCVLLPSDASPSQCSSRLAKVISLKLLSTIKHSYEHASPMYSLGLQINPFALGSILSTMVRIHDAFSFCLCACGKNPYTENANTSYYPAVLTFSYVRKLVLPPMNNSVIQLLQGIQDALISLKNGQEALEKKQDIIQLEITSLCNELKD